MRKSKFIYNDKTHQQYSKNEPVSNGNITKIYLNGNREVKRRLASNNSMFEKQQRANNGEIDNDTNKLGGNDIRSIGKLELITVMYGFLFFAALFGLIWSL